MRSSSCGGGPGADGCPARTPDRARGDRSPLDPGAGGSRHADALVIKAPRNRRRCAQRSRPRRRASGHRSCLRETSLELLPVAAVGAARRPLGSHGARSAWRSSNAATSARFRSRRKSIWFRRCWPQKACVGQARSSLHTAPPSMQRSPSSGSSIASATSKSVMAPQRARGDAAADAPAGDDEPAPRQRVDDLREVRLRQPGGVGDLLDQERPRPHRGHVTERRDRVAGRLGHARCPAPTPRGAPRTAPPARRRPCLLDDNLVI
jgi:hypothetical protein